jgi:hypothetical protein
VKKSSISWFCLALALLAGGGPPAAGGQSKKLKTLVNILDKSAMIENQSRMVWHIQLVAPSKQEAEASGTLKVWRADMRQEESKDEKELKSGEALTLQPTQLKVLTPIPGKTVRSRVQKSARPNYSRTILFENELGESFTFTLARDGNGDKAPRLLTTRPT